MIIEQIKEFSSLGEIITGDDKEKKLINKIKKYLELYKIETRILPISVLHWNVIESHVECNGKKIMAILLPYSISHDIETEKYCISKVKNINEIYINYNLYINKCDIIILTLDEILRKTVIIFGSPLQHFPNPPPPIPVYYVPMNEIISINGKCRFYSKVKINPNAIGYIIEGIIPSKSDNAVVVSVHHDHWFNGEHDNLLGVSLLPFIRSDKYQLHLISFTATESGARGFSTFYWAYGSKVYLQKIIKDSNTISFNVNIDAIFGEPKIYVPPSLIIPINEFRIKNKIEVFSDSYNFIKYGIPSINITSVDKNKIHSEKDIIEKIDFNVINKIINVINKIINNNININKNEFERFSNNILKFLPLKLKSYFVNIIDNINNMPNYKLFLKLYGAIIDNNSTKLDAIPFHKIYQITNLIKGKIIYAEDSKINNFIYKSNINYNRFYNIYLNELLKDTEEYYIDFIYRNLKEFL
jgi:Iap family predicted aminopeptidase